LNIFVNTRLLLKNKLEGIGWFTYETLKRITTQHPEHNFIFAFDRKHSPEFIFSDNIIPVEIAPQTRHPLLYKIWFNFSIPRALRKYKADLFLSPDGCLPFSIDIPCVDVIHDINFEHYPKDLPHNYSVYYRKHFPQFARKASRLATVSEYSKQDIVSTYNIFPDKIDVVFNGVNEAYKPISAKEQRATKKKYTSGQDYFLFVSALHPRKNVANLFRAFASLKDQQPSNTKLLIVGNKKWWNEDIESAYQQAQCKDDIIFTGRLEPLELTNVMASALALTYVSYFEGFGIPIIEAFACHTPVITSNVTSMPEVAGDAALLTDPFSPESICDAMIRISSDEDLKNSLIKKGIDRLQEFSWQKSADLLWNCVSKVIDHS